MHYSRVPSAYWGDRLKKMRNVGLNAVQTYVPWNFHEEIPGQFNFTGWRDLGAFLRTAQENDLLVILRAGPYICAEWDMGGLPSYLLTNEGIELRTADPVYLKYVDRWMANLLPLVKAYLYENGGPIITVQVENEYGSYYACDKDYLKHLYDIFRQHLGPTVVLFTTDGANDKYLKCGTLVPYMYATVDFGSTDAYVECFDKQRDYEPNGPLVNSEFYTGWLDHWGYPHSTVNTSQVAYVLNGLLGMGANVNLYMFEGGTTFAFWNGADDGHHGGSYQYQPEPTSYDYNAPLTEAGDPWEKYVAISEVIGKFQTPSQRYIPLTSYKGNYGKVYMTAFVGLFDAPQLILNQASADMPIAMEYLNQSFGFVMYSTKIPAEFQRGVPANLTIHNLKDRAVVYVEGVLQGIRIRQNPVVTNATLTINIPSNATMLDIVVENMGRINYGPLLNDSKGILGEVELNGKVLTQWTSKGLPLNDTSLIPFQPLYEMSQTPNSTVFFRGTFRFDSAYDTFLNVSGWTKGVAFVNGFNLGRYWPVEGPQKTLYVPACYLRSKNYLNELILFEIDRSPCSPPYDNCYVSLGNTPDIG